MLDDQQVINQQLKEEIEVRLCNSLETIHLPWKLNLILSFFSSEIQLTENGFRAFGSSY